MTELKERDREILRLLASGLKHAQVAERLGLSKNTVTGVNTRCRNPEIYKKKHRIRRARVVERRARKCIKERIKRVDKILGRQQEFPLAPRTIEWLNHYRAGKNIIGIAELYPVSHQAIAKCFKRIGLDVKGLAIHYKKWGSGSSL